MEEKVYINPDEKLFSDKEWARDEYGFKTDTARSILKKGGDRAEQSTKSAKNFCGGLSIRGENIYLKNPAIFIDWKIIKEQNITAKNNTITLPQGKILLNINGSWLLTSASGGAQGSGYLLIGIAKKEAYQNGTINIEDALSIKMPIRILNRVCYESFSRILNNETNQDYYFFLCVTPREGSIQLSWIKRDITAINI